MHVEHLWHIDCADTAVYTETHQIYGDGRMVAEQFMA